MLVFISVSMLLCFVYFFSEIRAQRKQSDKNFSQINSYINRSRREIISNLIFQYSNKKEG